jgi:hypothetical protein
MEADDQVVNSNSLECDLRRVLLPDCARNAFLMVLHMYQYQ